MALHPLPVAPRYHLNHRNLTLPSSPPTSQLELDIPNSQETEGVNVVPGRSGGPTGYGSVRLDHSAAVSMLKIYYSLCHSYLPFHRSTPLKVDSSAVV